MEPGILRGVLADTEVELAAFVLHSAANNITHVP
jgi:hypothetical protein